MKARPMPKVARMPPPQTPVQYESPAWMNESQKSPMAPMTDPARSTLRGPNFGDRRPLKVAPMAMAAVWGRKVRPVTTGLYPRICWR